MSRHLSNAEKDESEYAKNQLLMFKARTRVKSFRLLLFFGNIVLSVFSLGYTYLWFSLHKVAMTWEVVMMDNDINGPINFPIFVVTLVAAPLFVILAALAEIQTRSIYVHIMGIISSLLFVLCLGNAIFGLEPVKPVNTFAFCLIMGIEAVASFFFVSAFSTMEGLKDKPGYPEFNFSVSGVLTAEQQKYMDYYNARQKGKRPVSNSPLNVDTSADTFGDEVLLPDEDYVVEDIRRKPL